MISSHNEFFLEECLKACRDTRSCVAVNYISRKLVAECQLLEFTHRTKQRDFVTDAKSDYYTVITADQFGKYILVVKMYVDNLLVLALIVLFCNSFCFLN